LDSWQEKESDCNECGEHFSQIYEGEGREEGVVQGEMEEEQKGRFGYKQRKSWQTFIFKVRKFIKTFQNNAFFILDKQCVSTQ